MKILSLHAKNIFTLEQEFKLEFDKGPLKDQWYIALSEAELKCDPTGLLHLVTLSLYNRLAFPVKETGSLDGRTLLPLGTHEASIMLRFIGKDEEEYATRWHVSATRSGRLVSSKLELFSSKNGNKIGRDTRETLHEIEKRIKMSFAQFEHQFVLPYHPCRTLLQATDMETQHAALLAIFTPEVQENHLSWIYTAHQQAQSKLAQLELKIQHAFLLTPAETTHLYEQYETLTQALEEKKNILESLRCDQEWHFQEKKIQDQLFDLHQQIEQLHYEKDQQEKHIEEKEKLVQAVWNRLVQLKTNYDLKKQEIEQARELEWHIQSIKNTLGESRVELRTLYQKHQNLIEQIQLKETSIRQTEEKYQQHALWLNDHSVLATLSQREEYLRHEVTHYLNKKSQIQHVEEQLTTLSQTINNLTQTLAASQEKKLANQRILEQLKHQIVELKTARHQPERQTLVERQQTLYQQLSALSQCELLYTRYQEWEEKRQLATTQQATLTIQLNDALTEAQTLEEEILTLSTELTEAQQDLKRVERLKHLRDLRSSLTQHQPCPVCGSAAHPWADRHLVTATELIQATTEQVATLISTLETKKIQQVTLKQHILHLQAFATECTQSFNVITQNAQQLYTQAMQFAKQANLTETVLRQGAESLTLLAQSLIQENQQISERLQTFAQLDATYQQVQQQHEQVLRCLEDDTGRCNQLHTERMLKEYQLTTVIERLNEFKHDLEILFQQLDSLLTLWRPDWEELLLQGQPEFEKLLHDDLHLYFTHKEEMHIWEKQLAHLQTDLLVVQQELDALKTHSEMCKQKLQEKNQAIEKLTERRTQLLEGQSLPAYELEMNRQIQTAEKLVQQEQEMRHALTQRLMQIEGQLKQIATEKKRIEEILATLYVTKPTLELDEIETQFLNEEQTRSHLWHERGMLDQQLQQQKQTEQLVQTWQQALLGQREQVQDWQQLAEAFQKHELNTLTQKHYALFLQEFCHKVNQFLAQYHILDGMTLCLTSIFENGCQVIRFSQQQTGVISEKEYVVLAFLMSYLFATDSLLQEASEMTTHFVEVGADHACLLAILPTIFAKIPFTQKQILIPQKITLQQMDLLEK